MTASPDVREALERLIEGLAEQQAMPDDWWRAEYAAVQASIATLTAEVERLRESLAERQSALEAVTLISAKAEAQLAAMTERAEKAESKLEFWNKRRETLLKVFDMLEQIRPLVLTLETLKDIKEQKK
jgi:hypothetical protein